VEFRLDICPARCAARLRRFFLCAEKKISGKERFFCCALQKSLEKGTGKWNRPPGAKLSPNLAPGRKNGALPGGDSAIMPISLIRSSEDFVGLPTSAALGANGHAEDAAEEKEETGKRK
jgi:hypothetical protein